MIFLIIGIVVAAIGFIIEHNKMTTPESNFIAVLMSGETDEYWFETEQEAWDYIHSRSCDSCKENPEWDSCGAEWDVWTKEEYNECTKK